MENQTTKICKSCNKELPIDLFEKNQYGKDNSIKHRSECKDCRKNAKRYPTPPAIARRQFEEENPRPKIGEYFTCQICKNTFIVQKPRDINLDHDHNTGEIRGWLCNRCNTGLGNLRDDLGNIHRASQWLEGKLR